MGKHGKYKKKYRKEWEKEKWAWGWLREAQDSENTNSMNEAFCKVCLTSLRAHHSDLMKHTETKKHKENAARMTPSTTQKKIETFVTIDITSEEKVRDLKLATYIATHASVRSVDHLNDVLKQTHKMDLKLHRTKCSGLIKNVIAPCLLQELIDDLGERRFSLIVDESTDKSTIKYLCICIKYFSTKANCIRINYLCILMLENATANTLYDCLTQFCAEHSIDLNNLVGLGTDGANSLCGKNHSLFSLLKETNKMLQLVRCVCHSLNNAGAKASEELPAHLDFLCREVYNWFQYSSNRKIDYKKTWELININEDRRFHQFVQLANTRWLSRYNVIKTLVEHWLELGTHFNSILNTEKCYTARMLADMLNDKSNYLYMIILEPVLNELNNLNLMFQRDNVDIGRAYDDLCSLILVIAKMVMTPQFADTKKVTIISEHISNDLAFLPPDKCDFGHQYFTYVSNKNIERKTVEERMFRYLKSLLEQLVNRLPDSLKLFKALQNLSPKVCLSQIKPVFGDLPFIDLFISSADMAKVEFQWKKIHTVEWSKYYTESILGNSYSFWPEVLKYRNAAEETVFKELADYALTCLSLPSSNAVVERAFSVMNAVKTKVRNRMQIKMLNSILRIRINFYSSNACCKDFNPSKLMIQKFKSKEVYSSEVDSDDILEIFDYDDNVNV